MSVATRRPAAGLIGMLVALQAGCGGPQPAPVELSSAAPLSAAAVPREAPPARLAAVVPVAARTADVLSPPRAVASAEPIDHAARTRAGLYVRRDEAERIDRELGGQVIWLDAACCSDEELELVAMLAYGEQAARNLSAETPLFVTGSDQRLAARLVNRLADAGVRKPYLVTR
jgi:hypothetical protein